MMANLTKRIEIYGKLEGTKILYSRLWHRITMLDALNKETIKKILLDEVDGVLSELRYQSDKLTRENNGQKNMQGVKKEEQVA